MKKNVIIYWISTGFIALLEGVMPAFSSQTEMAKEGIRHLGYPEYFGNVLVVFKILGVLALVLPQIPKRVKEWAYAGFIFDFLGAIYGFIATGHLVFPDIVMAPTGLFLCILTYYYWKKGDVLVEPIGAR